MRIQRWMALAALLAVAPAATAQTYSTIAFESFDYPVGTGLHGATGGTGWANAWWAGDPPNYSPIDHGVVVPGSLDAVGNAAEDQLQGTPPQENGSYRFPATAGFEHLIDSQGLFGEDGSVIWISFYSGRLPGSDDGYGGIILNQQFVAEQLFMGSPSTWFEWGIHDEPYGVNVVTTVTGSNVDQMTHLVYRIDFLPGQERVQLWLDPATDHPSTVADMDTMVHDFRFNEIGMKAGNSQIQHGWKFDAIKLDTPNTGAGVAYCFGDGSGTSCPCGNASANGGGCANGGGTGAVLTAIGGSSLVNDTLVFHCTDLVPNQPGLYFQGDNAVNSGAGVIFGDGLRCAGGNVVRLEVVVADGAGLSTSSIAVGAAGGVLAGDIKRYQLWYRDPATSPCSALFNLSNGLEVVWAP